MTDNPRLSNEFLRIGTTERQQIANKISRDLVEITKTHNLSDPKHAKTIALYVIGEYEKYRKELNL